MKIGLFFGTFNPIHVGHLAIANHMAQYTELEKIWFVVTPKNPFKAKQTLLEDYHRMALVRVAIEDNPSLYASDIEFKLPKPSFTIHTLTYLREENPDKEFSLLMGEDNLRSFHKWKNHEEIIHHHHLYIYPRISQENEKEPNHQFHNHPNVHFTNAPVMNISASFIRAAIKNNKSVEYLLTPKVYKYLTEMHFYE